MDHETKELVCAILLQVLKLVLQEEDHIVYFLEMAASVLLMTEVRVHAGRLTVQKAEKDRIHVFQY